MSRLPSFNHFQSRTPSQNLPYQQPQGRSQSPAPFTLPFSNFSTTQLSDLDNTDSSGSDSSSSSSDSSDDSSDSENEGNQTKSTTTFPSYRPAGLNVTSFAPPPPPPSLSVLTSLLTPQQPQQPKQTTPHPCLVGIETLKTSGDLSKSILNRLPTDMSEQSWEAWIAERRRRFPRIKRTDTPAPPPPPSTTDPSTSTLSTSTSTDTQKKPAHSSLLLDEYSDSDDDAPPVEAPLIRASHQQKSQPQQPQSSQLQPLLQPQKNTSSTTHITSTSASASSSPLPSTPSHKEAVPIAVPLGHLDHLINPSYDFTTPSISNPPQSSPTPPPLDVIHTSESNSDEINQTILTTRYPEYLTYLGLHPSVVYILSSYPPHKLPVFPLYEAPKNVTYVRGKPVPKHLQHQQNNQQQQQQQQQSTEQIDQLNNSPDQNATSTITSTNDDKPSNSNPNKPHHQPRPPKRQVDLLRCTVPTNPFLSLCLTLHQQRGFQLPPPIHHPSSTNSASDSTSPTNSTTTSSTPNQSSSTPTPNQIAPCPFPIYPTTTQPIVIDDVLQQCHKKLLSGSMVQINPQKDHGGSKFGKFKNNRDNRGGSSFKNNNSSLSSRDPSVLYVDLYKKLISRDLLQETTTILQSFHTIMQLDFFASPSSSTQSSSLSTVSNSMSDLNEVHQ